MTAERKTLLKGIAIGLVIVIAINLFSDGANAIYRSVNDLGMDPDKKLEEINSTIDKYYYEGVDESDLENGMYKGYVYGVGDKYTTYMSPSEYESFKENTSGQFAGIGVEATINKDTQHIEVTKVYDGSPAEKSGIEAGDEISSVDGFDVNLSNYDQAISMIKGDPGTTVHLSIYRPSDGSTFESDVVREDIDVPTVNYKMLEDNIGYISISKFDDVTLKQFNDALSALQQQNMEGLILDVRNNPGGLLKTVVNICDELMPEGTIIYTEDKNGNKNYYTSDASCINLPIVVLVNQNSASASEVLAGALHDSGVAELVGSTTYGKGVVQSTFELDDGSAIKLTTARYYTPNGVCINGTGIAPDYVVNMSDDITAQISTLPEDQDVQLEKAVEVMQDEISQ